MRGAIVRDREKRAFLVEDRDAGSDVRVAPFHSGLQAQEPNLRSKGIAEQRG